MSGVENDGLTFVGIDFEAICQEEPVEPVEVRLEYGLQDVGAAGCGHYGGVVGVEGVEDSVVGGFGYVVYVKGEEEESQGRALWNSGGDGVSGRGDVVPMDVERPVDELDESDRQVKLTTDLRLEWLHLFHFPPNVKIAHCRECSSNTNMSHSNADIAIVRRCEKVAR